MALCLAESLLARQGFDPRDQMTRYLNWWEWGYLSSTGHCFDIGMTVRDALDRFRDTGEPYSGSTHPRSAGNGSLMRLAPIALFFYPDEASVIRFSAESSRTTHGAQEAVECYEVLGLILAKCLDGRAKAEALDASSLVLSAPKVQAIARGSYAGKSQSQVTGSGYAVASLEAALWCFHSTPTFEAAVLAAVNLGDDADTTAAIAGQIAGAFYGVGDIPGHWLARLHMKAEIGTPSNSLQVAKNGTSGWGPGHWCQRCAWRLLTCSWIPSFISSSDRGFGEVGNSARCKSSDV